MSDNNVLIDAIGYIDDQNLKKYFSAKEKQSKQNTTKRKMSPKLKWMSAAAACLVLMISLSFAVVINNIRKEPLKTNEYSSVKLYSDGQKLYFIDTRGQSALLSYDIENGEINTVLNETVSSFAITDQEMLYTTPSGLYMRNTETGAEQKVMDFSGSKTDTVTSVNDKPLFENTIIEGCSDFNKNGSTVYFLYGAEKKLSYDEHTVIGSEGWSTIFALNTITNELTALKTTHNIQSFLSEQEFITDKPEIPVLLKDSNIYNLHFYNDELYYTVDSAEIRSIKADGTEDNTVYTSNGTIRHIYWNDNCVYISETTDYSNNIEAYHTKLSLNDKSVLYKTKVELSLFSTFDSSCYDKANDRFYTVFENNIISFVFENPADHDVLYTFNNNIDSMCANLIVVGGDLFCSYYDAVSDNSDCYIVRIANDQEKIIVKNDKPYDE